MTALARRITTSRPLNLALTVSPLGRGKGDPCHHDAADRSIWHASRLPSGTCTYRLLQLGRNECEVQAWGSGAQQLVETIDTTLCVEESLADFSPTFPKIVEANRRFPDLRMLRTGLVMESLVPAILEQKVHGIAARRSWRELVRKFGEAAPGPTPVPMHVAPTAETWRRIPSWDFHRANVDPQRAKTIVSAARNADALEAAVDLPIEQAHARLTAIPGIGVWTAAEVAQRAFGDADALSVGDFHLAAMVGWTLLGKPIEDDEMVELLEPLRPHRYRAIRLLGAAGFAFKPKFGPRTAVTDHRRH